MTTPTHHTQLGLKQYTKDVPPGFRPGAYPVAEYSELLKVWSILTTLEAGRIGAAIFSRLEAGALDIARRLHITRMDPTTYMLTDYYGIDAVSLLDSAEIIDPNDVNVVLFDAQPSGARQLVNALQTQYALEDQDRQWISLEDFFELQGNGNDFFEYDQLFESRYSQAQRYAALQIGDVGLAYLFWSKSGVDDKLIADLRLKVNGDLTRYREMISLHKRILNNEKAAADTSRSKNPFKLMHGVDDEYDDEHGFGYWTDDGYYYEYDYYYDCASYYDPHDDVYYDADDDDDDDSHYDQQDDIEHEYKGKDAGKGKYKHRKGGKRSKGSQCTSCGSKFHDASECPLNRSGDGSSAHDELATADTDDDWYGDRKRKSKGKGKRRGKGKRWHPRDAKRKGGKGKGAWRKGTRGHAPRFPRAPFAGGRRYYEENVDGAHMVFAGIECASTSQLARRHPLPAVTAAAHIEGTLSNDAPIGLVSGGSEAQSSTQPNTGAAIMLFGDGPSPSTSTSTSRKCCKCHEHSSTTCARCGKACCNKHSLSLDKVVICHSCYDPQTDVRRAPRDDVSSKCSDLDEASVNSCLHCPGGISTPRGRSPVMRTSSHDADDGTHGSSAHVDVDTVANDAIVVYDTHRTYDDPITGNIVSAVLAAVLEGQILHTVNGQEYCGLLLDPGASKGVLGSDTLNDIIDYVLDPVDRADQVQWMTSTAHFSGISASVQSSLALVSFPLGLMGMRNPRFQADLLGGSSSKCPGLMPLLSLINAAALAAFGCFQNGDGLIALQDRPTGKMCPQRLYLTDSGHYLLPIDLFDEPVDANLVSFMKKHFTHKLASSISGRGKGNKSRGSPSRGKGNIFTVTFLGNETTAPTNQPHYEDEDDHDEDYTDRDHFV